MTSILLGLTFITGQDCQPSGFPSVRPFPSSNTGETSQQGKAF